MRAPVYFLLLLSLLVLPRTSPADELFVYVGTYTSSGSEGIYVSTLDRDEGILSTPRLAAKADNPAFVALHPTRPLLYAVSEVREPAATGGSAELPLQGTRTPPSGSSNKPPVGAGSVTAFAIDSDSGTLTMLNKQSTQGGGPCHLSVDPTGQVVVAANYGGGSVCSFHIAEDGRLNEAASFIQHEGSSVNPQRQEGPHAHSANFDAASKYVIVCDLGLDKLLVYDVDTDTAELRANNPPSTSVAGGSGPRHFAFHPSGKFAYANLEMTSEVRAFRYHPAYGVLYGLHTLSTLPADASAEGNSTAETQVHPSGKFVYVSNRGHDSIAIFRVDPSTGELTAAGHTSTQGRTPRNFGIDPSGEYLIAANQQTGNVVVFRIDDETGGLRATGSSIEVPAPVCVRFWK